MDPINDYSDVIVISDDDDDAVNSEFKYEDNLGDKDKKKRNHLMPKKKIFHKYIKTEIDVFGDYTWKSIIEISLDESQIPDNSIIVPTSIMERIFHCQFCRECFPSNNLLKKHLKNHKQLLITDKKKITCKFCGKLFRFNFQLKRHIQRKICNKSIKIVM